MYQENLGAKSQTPGAILGSPGCSAGKIPDRRMDFHFSPGARSPGRWVDTRSVPDRHLYSQPQILVLIFPAKFFGEMAGRLAPLGEMAGGSSTCTQYVVSSEGQTNRTGWFQNFPRGNQFNSYVGFYRGSTAGMHVRYPPGMDLSGSGMSWVLPRLSTAIYQY